MEPQRDQFLQLYICCNASFAMNAAQSCILQSLPMQKKESETEGSYHQDNLHPTQNSNSSWSGIPVISSHPSTNQPYSIW